MVKTAVEKMQTPKAPRVVNELPPGALNWGPPGATMVISTPLELDALLRQIPKGKLATLTSLRDVIARRHGTTITCPVTTGLFLGSVARAAAEQEMLGMSHVTPWWRVIRNDGSLNEKYPGGVAEHEKRLAAESHSFVIKGRSKRVVAEFEKRIATLQP